MTRARQATTAMWLGLACAIGCASPARAPAATTAPLAATAPTATAPTATAPTAPTATAPTASAQATRSPPTPTTPTRTAPTASTAPTARAPAASNPTAPSPAPAPDPDDNAPPPPLPVWRSLPGLDILESATHASHVHGGPAAAIHSATLHLETHDRRAHTLRAERVELLHSHCRETTWTSRKPIAITGYELNTWTSLDPLTTVTSPTAALTLPSTPARYVVAISLDPFSVYQACDRTAFAVQLLVDGTRVSLEVPLLVKRFEPLRHPTP